MKARGENTYHCPYPGCTQAFTALRDWNAHTRRERFNSINSRIVFAVRKRTGNERFHLSTITDADQQSHHSGTMDGILASLGMLDLLPLDKKGVINKQYLDDSHRTPGSKEMWVRESRECQISMGHNLNTSVKASRDENTPPTPVPETLPNASQSSSVTSLTRTQWTLGDVNDRDVSLSPPAKDSEMSSRNHADIDDAKNVIDGDIKCQWETRLRQCGFKTFIASGACHRNLRTQQTLARHYLLHAMTQITNFYTSTCPVKDCEMILFQETEDETLEDMISRHNALLHPTLPNTRRRTPTSTVPTTKDVSSKRSNSPGSKNTASQAATNVMKARQKDRRHKSRSGTKEPSQPKEIPPTTPSELAVSRMTNPAETVEDSCDSDGNDVEGVEGVASKRKASQDHESQSHRRKTRGGVGNYQEAVDTPLVLGPFFTRMTER
ncbi:hypothetical protein EMPS_10964 [Entomortierella parvispora]|uniref:Uncharacterized protein n=1 Tax=Entomortierella parvispora TaxID=205924 RepID=A0A9P3HL64_9FUNG|nr:hypothetical protein EMPS_10964 [Entomortierella parvispora]